jgi:2-amino-4-hydroxy-6-hydroxymethyldihydropteridine diphosphokinase
MSQAYIALGSNLGDSAQILIRAMDRLQSLSAAPLSRSSLIKTPPVDCPPGSAPFMNAAVALAPLPGETSESLLRHLLEIEILFGRQPKKILNEPRPLDLDLIAFGSQIINTPELILPHPRAHLRRFVLQPLSEIAPNLILPGQKKTVRELVLALPPAE